MVGRWQKLAPFFGGARMEDHAAAVKNSWAYYYKEAAKLYERWESSRAVADWQALWLALQEQAERVIGAQCRGLRIEPERQEAMITDATIYLMEQIKSWPESGKRIDAGWISSRVWFACLNTRQRDYRTIKKLERQESYEARQEKRHQA